MLGSNRLNQGATEAPSLSRVFALCSFLIRQATTVPPSLLHSRSSSSGSSSSSSSSSSSYTTTRLILLTSIPNTPVHHPFSLPSIHTFPFFFLLMWQWGGARCTYASPHTTYILLLTLAPMGRGENNGQDRELSRL